MHKDRTSHGDNSGREQRATRHRKEYILVVVRGTDNVLRTVKVSTVLVHGLKKN